MNFNILEDLREEMELDEKMKLHLEKKRSSQLVLLHS